MDQLREWWGPIAGVIAFAVNYGFMRATIGAFRREVDELHEAAKPIVSIDKRLVVVETELRALLERVVPDLREEIEHVHDAAKAALAEVRTEISRDHTRPGGGRR